jgi:ribosomal protein S18 acetylase RimI-like enzyme
MSPPPNVRLTRRDELDATARVLTAAFVDEPGLNYWLRQGAAKERARKLFFDAAVREVVHPRRALWAAERDGALLGAALWLGPGQHAYDFPAWRLPLVLPRLLAVAGFSGGKRGLDLADKLAGSYPGGPHAHLAYLGVSPATQGQGVGSALLKHTLAPLDAAGTPALLEATLARNVTLYERHGFEVVSELRLPELHVRVMWREPRL